MSPSGEIVSFDVIGLSEPENQALFVIKHDGILIGRMECEVGNLMARSAIDFIIDGYLDSDEFQKSRKEAGRWN
ncbi:hypothetical protein [Mongoliitalea lutea]|uniref:hypothetical protein n=1 Tax=Mongoliitalea lutea TaxID=849756 RepID=UPI00167439EE|nr:hypothetical protein [Mongoliitalea lutea]